MRIFGIIFFGFISISLVVATIFFFSFYSAIFQTDFLFKEYQRVGVYKTISTAITSQISNATSQGSELDQNPLEAQMQEKFVSALFSEKSVQELIEKNLLRFKEFQMSDQETFKPFVPFSDSSMTDSLIREMGMEELGSDPEFKKMIQEASSASMSQNNPFQSLSPMAKNLRGSMNFLKIFLPIISLISVVIFFILSRGMGRVRNFAILSFLVSVNLWAGYLIWNMVFGVLAQNNSADNIGAEIALSIITPVIALGVNMVSKFGMFTALIGVVCLVVWFAARLGNTHGVSKAVVATKTKTTHPKKRT